MGEIAKAVAPAAPATVEEEKEVIRRAREGDRAVLPQLRALFDRDPARYTALGLGDVSTLARDHVIRRHVGDNLVMREAMTREIDRLAAELAGPDPSPIERMLAGRAALCWYEVNMLELASVKTAAGERNLERRRESAHRRHLSALKALAQVRKLRLPSVQVNIASGHQVNVAGDVRR